MKKYMEISLLAYKFPTFGELAIFFFISPKQTIAIILMVIQVVI